MATRPPPDAFARMFEAKRAEQAAAVAEAAVKAADQRVAELREHLASAHREAATLRAAAMAADVALPRESDGVRTSESS